MNSPQWKGIMRKINIFWYRIFSNTGNITPNKTGMFAVLCTFQTNV